MTRDIPPCFRFPPRQWFVAREGFRYLGAGLLATLAVGWFSPAAALVPLAVTLYIAWFFRNPHRPMIAGEGLIVSPADGRVLEVAEDEEPLYLKAKALRISIFMSPMNCHINRAPVSGKIVDCFYRKGSFKAAFKEKAMQHNEHHALLMEDLDGKRWLVVQIAGWLARRIVSYVQGGEDVERGERFGLIQFGSRLDLYCPLGTRVFVKPGHKVVAGKTLLGMGTSR